MRSAERAIGVSGFLISWATRCATSFHANWRCARKSSVVSSTTSTVPACPLVNSRRALVMARWMVRPRAWKSISVEAAPMRWPRRMTPARSSAHSAGSSASMRSPARLTSSRLPISAAKARFDCSTKPAPSSVTTPLGMVSTIVSNSRRRSSMARLAAVSCADELSANCRLASRSAAMRLKARTRSPISPVATCATRWSYLPAAISSMASASASTGRVICLDKNSASQTLEKKTKTVISSSIRKNMVRIWLRERKSCQYSSAPERMRAVVWLRPCGMGRAATTTLPDGVADHPARNPGPPP